MNLDSIRTAPCKSAGTLHDTAAARNRAIALRRLASAVLLSAVLAPLASSGAENRSDIDRFVRGMDFDPRRVLSAHSPDTTQALPARRNDGNGVTLCKATQHNASGETNDISILSPTAGTIYPGALVRVNRALVEGRPQALPAPRGPVTLRLDLPGQRAAGTRVEQPSFSNVQSAIDNILIDWINARPTHGFNPAARHTLNTQRAYSREQVAASLGLNAQWINNSFTANIRGSHQSKTKTYIALFRQIYYSAIADLPKAPSAVFAPQMTLASLRQQIDNDNPPGFVRSVDYGRHLLIRIDTEKSVSDIEIDGALRYAAGQDTSVNAELASSYHNIVRNARITVLAIGGNAQDAVAVTGMSGLRGAIRSGATFGRENPGVPISYTVTFLRDHAIAAMRFTADHTEWTCTQHRNAYIRLRHDGAYVARFEIDWREHDDSGAPVERQWRSGSQTAGWTHTQHFPGDAEDIRIRAYAYTGLAWNRWAETINTRLKAATNRCFRIAGAVHNRTVNEDCR